MTRIYDPEVAAAAPEIPMLDISDVPGARETVHRFGEDLVAAGMQRPSSPEVEEAEQTIPGPAGAPDIPIRLYLPKSRPNPAPCLINYHGGAFVLGDLETEHPRCLAISAATGAVAIGVDYRLAPEHPFPAGPEDCYAALVWVAENAAHLGVDPRRIAVAGGSAGGALSAAASLMARDRGGPDIALQMLFYPVIDNACATASMAGGADCHIWNTRNCLDMWQQYLGASPGAVSPYASPARATDLAGLAPAYITACEHDPLRDEAIHYAMGLMNAGVPVELQNYAGTVHAFDLLTPSKIADRAMADQIAAFRRAVR